MCVPSLCRSRRAPRRDDGLRRSRTDTGRRRTPTSRLTTHTHAQLGRVPSHPSSSLTFRSFPFSYFLCSHSSQNPAKESVERCKRSRAKRLAADAFIIYFSLFIKSGSNINIMHFELRNHGWRVVTIFVLLLNLHLDRTWWVQ